MPTLALNRRTLNKLPDVAAKTVYFDTALRGFGLVVRPPAATGGTAGTRTWIIQYRPWPGGRAVSPKRLVIGTYPAMQPERAREAAEQMLAGVKLGSDPAAAREEVRKAPTIGELIPTYSAATDPKRKAKTIEMYEAYWRIYIAPALGSARAREVTPHQIAKLHIQIGEAHPTTANRVVTLLQHFYAWAGRGGKHVPEGYNPARGIARFGESGRERYLSDEELSRLGAALHEAETVGIPWAEPKGRPRSKHAPATEANRRVIMSAEVAAAIRLLIFTGARLREILHLKWSYFDAGRGLLLLPDSKTGRKPIVLGGAALEILKAVRARAEAHGKQVEGSSDRELLSEYVIPGADLKKPRADLKKPWAALTRHAELEGLRIHDLRHGFASAGAGLGLGLQVIGNLLGHKNTGTTARYAHLATGPTQRAADAIGETLAAALNKPR